MGDSEISMFGRLPNIKVLKMGHSTDKPFVPPPDSEGSGIITDRGVLSLCPSNTMTSTFTRTITHESLKFIKFARVVVRIMNIPKQMET